MRRFTRVYPHKVVICLSRLHVLLIGIVLYSVLNRDVNRVWPTEFSIYLPTEKRSTKTEKVFNIGELLKRWNQEDREFINFNFTGKGSFDDLALGAIEYETRKLKLNDDTTHVIKVHFNE